MRGWKMDASDRFVRAGMNSVWRTDGRTVGDKLPYGANQTKLYPSTPADPAFCHHLPPPFPIPFHRRSQRAGVCSWLTLIACCMMQNTVRKFSIDANVQSLTVNSFVRITQGTGGKWVFGFTVHSLFVCVWDWAARIFLDARIGNCIIGSWYTAFPGDLFCAAIFPASIHYRLTEADGSSCCHRVRWQVI